MKPHHYAIQFRLQRKERYLVWISAERDSILLNHKGRILVFKSLKQVKKYLKAHQLKLQTNEVAKYDFDHLKNWAESPHKKMKYPDFLAAWNFFDDLAYTTGKNLKGYKKSKSIQKIYDKLFYACNLPAITPPGKKYIPVWSAKETRQLQKVIKSSIRFFRKKIKKF